MAFLLRVAGKGLLLFAVINLLVALWVEPGGGQVSAYNSLFPGRPRFPFGETPLESYNFSLFNLDAMFASHEVSGDFHYGEFRVFIIGDSSVWGTLLKPDETLAGQLNAMSLQLRGGRPVHFYNLGYPTLSLTKDLLLLDRALKYRPDMVIWLVTLEGFLRESQLSAPLVANNPGLARDLLIRYNIEGADDLVQDDLWQRTLLARRKDIADVLRLQLYGVLWAATGIDQVYPQDYPRAQIDLDSDETFHNREKLQKDDLAFDVLHAGQTGLKNIPLLVVNEPILISPGENNQIRYNFYYPRWAYDLYRGWLDSAVTKMQLMYLDAWDLIPPENFTNSAIHYDATGAALLAEQIKQQVLLLLP